MKKHYQNKKESKIIFKAVILLSVLIGNAFAMNAQNCVINAGVLNESICQNDAMTLSGNSPSPIIGSAKWTQISGPSVIINTPNNPITTVSGYTGGNTYIFRYSATCGDGVVAFQDKTVVVYPITIADAGADIASCANSSGAVVATGNEPLNPGESGHWEIAGPNTAGVVINFPNSAVTTLTLPATSCGTTTLSWIIEGPEYAPGQNCTSSSQMTVTNYGGVVPVSAGADITLGNCYTTTQNTNLDASFGGCGLNGQQGTWTFVSGPNAPFIANANQNNTNVSNLIAGNYVFRWTVTGPCVSGSDTVTVIVPAATQDVTVLPGGDENIYFCDPSITQATLTAQTPLYAGETVQWTQVAGTPLPPGSIQSPNSPSTLVTGLSDAGDPYRFRYTLTNANTGCTFTKDYIIEYRGASRTIIANNGNDIFGACGETEFTIPLATTGTGINRYRILSGPSTSPLAPFPTAGAGVGSALSISLIEPGTYVIQFLRTETGSLPVNCDYGYDSITLVVSDLPTPSNAGSDVNLACGLTEAPLSGVGTAPSGSHYWSQLSGPNTAIIVDNLAQNTFAQGLISGSYVFQYITKGGGSGCAYSIDTVNVNVSSSSLSTPDAGTDEVICIGSQAPLGASPPQAGEFGTWSQISGPATVVFSNINDANAVATGFNDPAQTYVLRWTLAYSFPGPSGCGSPVHDDVTINTTADTGPTVATAGTDACYPGGTTTIALDGNSASLFEQGTWTAIPATGVVFADANNPDTTVTIPTDGTYIFTWTLVQLVGFCNPTFDSVQITIAEDPAIANAGPDQDVCGNQVTMNATLTSGSIGTWTQVSGFGGYSISDIHDPDAVFTFAVSGGYIFRWTAVSGTCLTSSDDVRLRVGIPPPSSNAGPDQEICSVAVNPTVTMTGNNYNAFFETGEWSLLSGAPNLPTITDALNPNTTITNLVSGSYTFRWTIAGKENFLCPPTFDDVIIEVSPSASAGEDQTHCDVDNVQLVGTINSTGVWTLTGGNPAGVLITQSPSNSYVANATVVPGNTYEFTYTTSVYSFASGGTCSGSSDSVNVTLFDGASMPPNAGADQNVCIDDVGGTVTVSGNPPPGDVDAAEWRFVYQPAGSVATITTSSSPVTTVANMTVPGLYVLEWVFSNASCRDLSDIVRINVYEAPSTANAGPDDTVACQQIYHTNATAPLAGIGTWSFLNPSDDPSGGAVVIDSPNNPQTTLSNITTLGTYILTWTVTNGPFTNPSLCAPSTDAVAITFNDEPPSNADAGPDQELCAATQTNLEAVPLSSGLGSWTQISGPVANIASPNAPNTVVLGLTTGTYEFIWTATTQNNDGCSSSDTIKVEILQQPLAADAGPSQILPQFAPVIMSATAPTVGIGTWSQISGPSTAFFANSNSPTTQVSGTIAGNYVFQWQITNGICSPASDIMSLEILALADLELTNTVTPTTANYGDVVSFTISIFNNPALGGSVDATGVAVKNLIPSGYTLVPGSVSNGGIYNAGDLSLTWSGLTIASGATLNLTFDATVNATGNYINTVQIIAMDQIDQDSTPNNDDGDQSEDDEDNATIIAIPPPADLSVTKTVVGNTTTPLVGSQITFEIVVRNEGPEDATGVQVTDLLPDGYAYVSFSSSMGIYDENTGIWSIGSIGSGELESLLIDVIVLPTGSYLNVAELLTSDQPDPDSTPGNNVNTEDDYDSVSIIPIALAADLSLTKTVNNPTPAIGSQVSFEIVVTNNGPQNTTGVEVRDLLPNGYTYTLFSATAGTYNSITGIWNVGALPSGSSETLIITATVNATGVYQNTAEVTASNLPDPDSVVNNGIDTEDDYASVNTTPTALSADLSLTKTVDNTTPLVGTSVTFTLTATNDGPNDVTGVNVTDFLPSGYTFIASTTTQGAYNPTTGIWTIGNITTGTSEILQLTATVNATGIYLNTAEVTSSNLPDPDSTAENGISTEDDYASVTTTPISGADLSLTKTIIGGNTSPSVGSQITFNITVSNAGPETATGVTITDMLPSGYLFVFSNATQGIYDAVTGIWTLGTIASGNSEFLQVTVTVNATGNYENIAELTSSNQADPDSTPGNGNITEDDYASLNLTPTALSSDLSLTKTVDNPTPLVGTVVTFTIAITNSGPDNTAGVTITDLLPTGYIYVSNTATQGIYNSTTGLWTVGTIANGTSEILQVTATVNGSGIYLNTAEITTSDQPDPDSIVNNGIPTEDDYGSATTAPIALTADLSLTKSIIGGNATPLVGSQISFEIVITNAGPDSASGVEVTDLLPTGYTYSIFSATSGTYNSNTGVWNVGTLASGDSETLIITAIVNATGNYQNITEVTASDQPDPDSTVNNNVITEDDYASVTTVPIAISADLSITKTVNNAAPLVGSNVVFEIIVTNNGPQDAPDIQVADMLPSGYAYIIATTTAGIYNNNTGIWSIGTIPSGASETLLINANVLPSGNYLNTAEITASSLPDPDSTPGNGVVFEDDYASAITFPVATAADLSLTKTVNNATPLIGTSVTFEIIITNNGPQPATSVEITDLLPSGYSYVIASTTAGVYNNVTGIWLLGTLASGASETMLINANVMATGDYLNIAEVTASNVPDPDSTPSNGIATEDDYATAVTFPVLAAADLSLTKTIVGGNATPLVGSQLIFEIIVSNAGPQTATGVVVTDLLPSGYSFVSYTATEGVYNNATGAWNIGSTITSGTSKTLQITASVNATGNYLNETEVTASNLPDPDSTPDNGAISEDDYSSALTVPIPISADLSITKTVNNSSPLVGTGVIFEVTVTNNGPQAATGVQITDHLPSGYSYVLASTTSGIYNSVTGVWFVGTLASGASETMLINGTVLPAGNYLNTAEITASNLPDPDSTPNNGVITEDDYATAGTVPVFPEADLSLTKTIVGGNTAPLVGSQIIFDITVTNDGPQSATGVTVTDQLPSGYTFLSYTTTEGVYTDATGIWNIGSAIPPGTSKTLQITASVNATGNYLNAAEVTSSDIADPDSAPDNGITTEDDYASVITIPVQATADLSLTKTVNNTSPTVGSAVTFEIIVTNNGPQSATGVRVRDLLPLGYSYVLVSTTSGSYNSTTGVWTVGTLSNGTSETMLINGVVLPTGNYLNTAEVIASDLPDPDSTPDNGAVAEDDFASVATVPVIPSADLSITKTIVGGNTTPLVGSQITFEIIINNAGPEPVASVQVSDLLPSGYTFVSYNATEGVYNAATGLWNINDAMAVGASNSLQIIATVNPSGNYLNSAEITASSLPDPDSTPGNGIITEDDYSSVVTVPIATVADLSLTKTVLGGNLTPLIGSQVSFEILVNNTGPQSVTGVQVMDLLPSGFDYDIHSTTSGSYNSNTGLWNIGSLFNGDSETLIITATVNASGVYTNTAEITASSLPDPDSVPGNGIASEDDYDSVTLSPVPSMSDLSLEKTVVGGNLSPVFGTTITFQVTVTNNGPQNATGVKVLDLLPNGYEYVVFSSTSGIYDQVTGIWNVGTIMNGTSETLLITVVVNSTGNYRNTAELFESDWFDPDSTPNNGVSGEDDIDSISITPIQDVADLSVTKQVEDNQLTPLVGSQISFVVKITNSGPGIADGVIVRDILPSGYDFVFYNSSSGTYNIVTGEWNLGIIMPGSSETLVVHVIVNNPTGTPDEYLNEAEVIATNQSDPDSTPDNGNSTEDDYASIAVIPIMPVADLSITKTVSNSTPAVGSQVTFEVVAVNDGPQDVSGVTVSDLLLSGYSYLFSSSSAGTYNPVSGLWNIGNIQSGSIEVLIVTATVTTGNYENIAQIMTSSLPDPDSTPGNDIPTEDDQASVTIVPVAKSADLSLSKTVDNATPFAGEPVTFEISVVNSGPNDATTVQVADLLPSGYVYVISSTTSGTYNPATGLWNIGSITAGSTETLLVTATVLANRNHLNSAQVTASDLPDPDSTPNNDNGTQSEDDEDAVEVTVPGTDIEIQKDVDIEAPAMNTEVTFTITAKNLGNVTATNLQVIDLPPTGYEFVSAASTSGEYDPSSGIWMISAIAAGSQQILNITVKVIDRNDYLNVASLAILDQMDTNAANDQDSALVAPRCLTVYNEFSPNDDGDNDTFYIDCIDQYPNNILEIFSRWGDMVYSRKRYDNSWDGTSNATRKVLPVGTYFYVLDLGDGSGKTSGWLYLKR